MVFSFLDSIGTYSVSERNLELDTCLLIHVFKTTSYYCFQENIVHLHIKCRIEETAGSVEKVDRQAFNNLTSYMVNFNLALENI